MCPNPCTGTLCSTAVSQSRTSDVPLQTSDAQLHLSPSQSLRHILSTLSSHFCGDHTYQNVKYLEQLLNWNRSLANGAVVRFSGNTLADILTPRAHDTLQALYALAALANILVSSTKANVGDIPAHCPPLFDSSSTDQSPPTLPNPNLTVSRTYRIYISISTDWGVVVLFILASASCIAFFTVHIPWLCPGY